MTIENDTLLLHISVHRYIENDVLNVYRDFILPYTINLITVYWITKYKCHDFASKNIGLSLDFSIVNVFYHNLERKKAISICNPGLQNRMTL